MKLTIFLVVACLSSGALGQLCLSQIQTCNNAYNNANPNQQDVAIRCQIIDALKLCGQRLQTVPDCSNYQSQIQAMTNTATTAATQFKCATTATANRCEQDVNACERAFIVGISDNQNDPGGRCVVSSTLQSCLNARDQDVACLGFKPFIDKLRKTLNSQLSQDNCDVVNLPKIDCSNDIAQCQNRFLSAVSLAKTDTVKICNAGADFEACLSGREGLAECKGEQSQIQNVRAKYQEQLDQGGCGSAHSKLCVQGIDNCDKTFKSAFPTLTTTSLKCNQANTLISCLNGVSCSASFQGQKQAEMTMLNQNLQGVSCSLETLTGKAGVVSTSAMTLFLGLLLCVLCYLRH